MLKTALLLACIEFVHSRNMEGFVVGGEDVDIVCSGHSAYITMKTGGMLLACGASILNQNMVLTAAHCFEDFNRHSNVTVRAGNTNKLQGAVRHVKRVTIHPRYRSIFIENDIALAYFRIPLRLGTNITRVAVMKDRPKTKFAYLDGWGMIDDNVYKDTNVLHRVQQPLWSYDECKKVLRKVPEGILCGGAINCTGYAFTGDLRNGLVILKPTLALVGVVSFTLKDATLYANVMYQRVWI